MQVQIFAAHWGNNELAPQVFIDRVKQAGFDGIEMSLPLDPAARDDWTGRIAAAGLGLIAQQWETVFHPSYEPHRAALAELLHNACAAKPLHVNSHTGKDYFTPAQNRALLELAEPSAANTACRSCTKSTAAVSAATRCCCCPTWSRCRNCS